MLTVTQLGTVAAGATTSLTSDSISPTAGLLLVAISASGNSAATGAVTTGALSTTLAGSWSWQVVTAAPATANSEAVHLFWATVPASPGSGTVTVTLPAAPAAARLAVVHIAGGATLSGAVSVVHATATSLSVTTATTPTADDLTVYVLGSRNDTSGSTPGATYTELIDSTGSTPTSLLAVGYRTGSTSTTADVSGLSSNSNTMIAAVISGGAAPSTWSGSTGSAVAASSRLVRRSSCSVPCCAASHLRSTFSSPRGWYRVWAPR